MHLTIDGGCQTDTGIAGRSEGDEIRFARQLTLNDVVVERFRQQDGATLVAALEDEQLRLARQIGRRQGRFMLRRRPKRLEAETGFRSFI